MRNRTHTSEPLTEAAPAAVLVEIVRNFHINEAADVPERSTRKSFVAGDRHVVDKAVAELWAKQGHAKLVDEK